MRQRFFIALLLFLAVFFFHVLAAYLNNENRLVTVTLPEFYQTEKVVSGVASWYGVPFHGRLTANGERYNMHGLTAASRTLPLGTYLEVKNLHNNRRVIVRVNDRGPYIHGRTLDLSLGAAEKLGCVDRGVIRYEARVLKQNPIRVAELWQ